MGALEMGNLEFMLESSPTTIEFSRKWQNGYSIKFNIKDFRSFEMNVNVNCAPYIIRFNKRVRSSRTSTLNSSLIKVKAVHELLEVGRIASILQ